MTVLSQPWRVRVGTVIQSLERAVRQTSQCFDLDSSQGYFETSWLWYIGSIILFSLTLKKTKLGQ